METNSVGLTPPERFSDRSPLLSALVVIPGLVGVFRQFLPCSHILDLSPTYGLELF